MDFRLTEAQELLVHTARDFFQQHCPTTLVQQLALDQRGFPDELWRQISALGWPGLLIPATLDGSDGSLLDIILLIEEMGRACFPVPTSRAPWSLRPSCSRPEAAPNRSASCRRWRVESASARWR